MNEQLEVVSDPQPSCQLRAALWISIMFTLSASLRAQHSLFSVFLSRIYSAALVCVSTLPLAVAVLSLLTETSP